MSVSAIACRPVKAAHCRGTSTETLDTAKRNHATFCMVLPWPLFSLLIRPEDFYSQGLVYVDLPYLIKPIQLLVQSCHQPWAS